MIFSEPQIPSQRWVDKQIELANAEILRRAEAEETARRIAREKEEQARKTAAEEAERQRQQDAAALATTHTIDFATRPKSYPTAKTAVQTAVQTAPRPAPGSATSAPGPEKQRISLAMALFTGALTIGTAAKSAQDDSGGNGGGRVVHDESAFIDTGRPFDVSPFWSPTQSAASDPVH